VRRHGRGRLSRLSTGQKLKLFGFSVMGRSFRSPGYSRNCRLPSGIVGAALRRRPTTLDAVLVEDVFNDRVRRAVVPVRIVVVIKSDCGDRSLADIGASPTAAAAQELTADPKIRMFQWRPIARPDFRDRLSLAANLLCHRMSYPASSLFTSALALEKSMRPEKRSLSAAMVRPISFSVAASSSLISAEMASPASRSDKCLGR